MKSFAGRDFENINLDLIFGIPGQTLQQWETSLEATVALGPHHISAYCLTYEEDTEYFLRLSRGQYRRDESLETDLFEMTMDVLRGSGFFQSEISNYARRGRECRHNLAYWLGADFLGLGPSAFSTVGFCRWRNISDTAAYISAVENGASPSDFREVLDERALRVERIAFSLRTNRGVAADLLPPSKAEGLAEIGLLRRRADRWCLTRKGKRLADLVAVELISMTGEPSASKALFALWNPYVSGHYQLRDRTSPAGTYRPLSEGYRRLVVLGEQFPGLVKRRPGRCARAALSRPHRGRMETTERVRGRVLRSSGSLRSLLLGNDNGARIFGAFLAEVGPFHRAWNPDRFEKSQLSKFAAQNPHSSP